MSHNSRRALQQVYPAANRAMSTEKLNSEPRMDESGAHSVMAADIRSTDGKYHRMVFDRSKELLEFTVTGGDTKQPRSMLKDINELLSVRGTPIIMRRGLPVDLNKSAKQADTPNSLFFYFAEKRDKCKWRIREVIAVFTTSSEKKHWLDALNCALKALPKRPKTLLIFVNPYGGKGRAKKIYAKQVELILALADIECEVVMTQRANHAFDELKQLVASKWNSIDGVVSVGGDGLFNECLSAIVCRSQEEADKDITDINIDTLETPRMRFGIIGAGSANSIVSSVHGTDDCPTAAIHIAMGSQCPVDVCTVHRGDDLMRISANAISYGWLGDVLADSELYRWMGPFRYQFSALRTTILNPSYFGRVSFCLINEGDPGVVFPKCAQGCTLCERLHPRLIKYFGRELDLNQPIKKRGRCCISSKKKLSNIVTVEASSSSDQILWSLHPRLIKYFGRELDLNQPIKKRGRCCISSKKKLSNIVTVEV
ncbi:Ceramide kinase [Toxocara canis]|uniref:Ceramide kinase n=1 Tax=Toxocara canis TaxID=6265 RepID=A0A0B2V0Z2_TOXCA|nr:Ceramide kinase [Toxocara canis]